MTFTQAAPNHQPDSLPEGAIRVSLPSGDHLWVLNEDEADYVTELALKYHRDNTFNSTSDLAELDRIIRMEMLMRRWSQFLTLQGDYRGKPVDESDLKRNIKEFSLEVRQLKKMLGIDRVARERERGKGSLAEYIANLTARAKRFGVMREMQLDRALELSNQLKSLVIMHDNSTPKEREKLHVTPDDIVEWIRTVYMPEFDEIDAHFREHDQKYWIREQ